MVLHWPCCEDACVWCVLSFSLLRHGISRVFSDWVCTQQEQVAWAPAAPATCILGVARAGCRVCCPACVCCHTTLLPFCVNGATAWQSALKLWCSHDCADSQQRLMRAAGQLWSHSPVLHVVLGPVRRCCAGSVACVAVAGARYCIKSWSCDHAYL